MCVLSRRYRTPAGATIALTGDFKTGDFNGVTPFQDDGIVVETGDRVPQCEGSVKGVRVPSIPRERLRSEGQEVDLRLLDMRGPSMAAVSSARTVQVYAV